jgi:hypothetical protein
VRVHRIDQPAVMEQKLIARNARAKRAPKSEAVAQVDREMTIKLAELGADGALPKALVQLSSAKEPLRLEKVDTAGLLHFVKGTEEEVPPAAFEKFPLRDRAMLVLALSDGEPDNPFLYGIAGFYLECAGMIDAAEFYYGKAGRAAAAQFATFFDQ